MSDKMWVTCYCSYTLGFRSTPDGYLEVECDTDFEVEVYRDEFEHEEVMVTCPRCGNELSQKYDSIEPAE